MGAIVFLGLLGVLNLSLVVWAEKSQTVEYLAPGMMYLYPLMGTCGLAFGVLSGFDAYFPGRSRKNSEQGFD